MKMENCRLSGYNAMFGVTKRMNAIDKKIWSILKLFKTFNEETMILKYSNLLIAFFINNNFVFFLLNDP